MLPAIVILFIVPCVAHCIFHIFNRQIQYLSDEQPDIQIWNIRF